MATIADTSVRERPFAPDTYERVLSAGAVILLAAVLIALFKGRGEWALLSFGVQVHLVAITVAVALTPIMLLRPRGTPMHRQLGWVWIGSMVLAAVISFGVRGANHGGFSIIHLLSAWVLIQVPLIVLSARAHNVKRHRRAVRGLVTGALLIAGFFTFPFDRLMGHWLFS